MAIAVSHPTAGTVIAVDQRHSAYRWTAEREIPLRHADYGGKLGYLGDGWLTALGNSSLYAALAFDRLKGVDASDLPTICRTLERLAPVAHVLMAEHWPDVAVPAPFCVQFGLACGNTVASIRADGSVVRLGPGAYVVEYPIDVPSGEADAMRSRFLSDVSRLRTNGDLVRRVARECADVSARSDVMSPTIDMGLTGLRDFCLCGRASDLAVASDDRLVSMLRLPAANDPRIWSRLADELEPLEGNACSS